MTGTPILEVVDGGLQTTVQDLGRPGYRDQGVPDSGACDPAALALANRLVGNDPSAAGLECTILGPTLIALDDIILGISGADLGALREEDGRQLLPGERFRLRSGDRLRFVGPRGPGCRAYLAVEGGIDVPVVLGSRSTCLPGGFGGHEGRALQAGDRLASASGSTIARQGRMPDATGSPVPGGQVPSLSMTGSIRVLPAPGLDAEHERSLRVLLGAGWAVGPASDRRGLRLSGPPLAFTRDAGAGSQPMLPGAIQVSPNGMPILLLADSGTTGGYPVVALVISADLRLAGQARPGDELRFDLVGLAQAREAARQAARWTRPAPPDTRGINPL